MNDRTHERHLVQAGPGNWAREQKNEEREVTQVTARSAARQVLQNNPESRRVTMEKQREDGQE